MNEEEGRTVATKAMKRYLTTPRRCQHLRFWHVVASRTICSHEGTLEQIGYRRGSRGPSLFVAWVLVCPGASDLPTTQCVLLGGVAGCGWVGVVCCGVEYWFSMIPERYSM